jgi:hypothetical protein
VGERGDKTDGDTPGAGARSSEGGRIIPSIRNGEVLAVGGGAHAFATDLCCWEGLGHVFITSRSCTGGYCWSATCRAKVRGKSWKRWGGGVGDGDRGSVCCPVDEAVTKELALLLAGLPMPMFHFSSRQLVAHHASVGQLFTMV